MHAVQYSKCEIRENQFYSGIVQEIETKTKIETIAMQFLYLNMKLCY